MSQPKNTDYQPDILGTDFEARTLELGRDPEGEGDVFATLVRFTPSTKPDRTAIVWVHGMTDYFFQDHVARAFDEQGYAFYGLDLRKCGRSIGEGHTPHYAESMNSYFPDLTAALDHLTDHGHEQVVFLAHSTGGLIVALWMDHLRRAGDKRHNALAGLILNSPWLDLQFSPLAVAAMKAVVPFLGRKFPRFSVRDGGFTAYGESIHKDYHGEWDYDLKYKPLAGHPLFLGWFRAILEGQKQIHNGGVDVGVPVLTLRSSDSFSGREYSAATDTADVVLDVEQIAKRSPLLGRDVTISTIEGARHDVFLSQQHAREKAFHTTFDWLRNALNR